MIEDLAKMMVYGYVGSKVGKAVEKRMDERQRERDEAIQELKKFAFIIYDGKAPYTAAQNLAKYLGELGYQAGAIAPEMYHSRLEGTSAEEYCRWVIIGHHDFTSSILRGEADCSASDIVPKKGHGCQSSAL